QCDTEITAGMTIVVGTADGQQMPARISEVTDETLTLDMNHPLAGKALTFSIKIVEA
ncbi:MAG: hypothetical protein PWQ44_1955, partial [Methanolobus sp.]|nr:hypothetical protein [Methanolobus sp.]